MVAHPPRLTERQYTVAEATGNPTSGVQAIPTSYRGVSFRSRLEATWAYNLDAWGISWSYEPEGFTLPSGARYLPDFWLPDIRTWLEVKGPGVGGLEKTREFAKVRGRHPRCPQWSPNDDYLNDCPEHGTTWPGRPCATCRQLHSLHCCGATSSNAWEYVIIGLPPLNGKTSAYGPGALDFYPNVTPEGSRLEFFSCRYCNKFQFMEYAGRQKCRACYRYLHDINGLFLGSARAYTDEWHGPEWKQMQWMPNGSGR